MATPCLPGGIFSHQERARAGMFIGFEGLLSQSQT